jgi:cathepsin B
MSDKDLASKAKLAASNRNKKKTRPTTEGTVKKAVVICAVSVAVAVTLLYLNPPKSWDAVEVNSDALITHINQNAKIWTAAPQPMFEGLTVGDVRDWGSIAFRKPDAQWHLCPAGVNEYPETFDVRQQWPECFPDHVYTQGNCSSSWAIAPVSALANRYCIQDPVNFRMLQLSPQTLVSCDKTNDGCNGGGMDTVWTYLMEEGVVSEMCFGYTGSDGTDCSDRCATEQPLKVAQKCIAQGAEAVRKEVYANGPVTVSLRLTDELLLYKSGVFLPTRTATPITEPKRKQMRKSIMVKIMGWGVEDEQPYWLIEGVFGKEWGEDGFGKIAIDDDAEGGPDKATILTDFTFAGYPTNMRFGGAADDFDDINLDDAEAPAGGDDDISFDDDDETGVEDAEVAEED